MTDPSQHRSRRSQKRKRHKEGQRNIFQDCKDAYHPVPILFSATGFPMRQFPLLFLALFSASFAALPELHPEICASAMVLASIDNEEGSESEFGPGGRIAIAVDHPLTPSISIAGNLGYLAYSWSATTTQFAKGKATYEGTEHTELFSQSLSLDGGVQYKWSGGLSAFGGLGLDFPFSVRSRTVQRSRNTLVVRTGDSAYSTTLLENTAAQPPETPLVLGIGYQFSDKFGLNLRLRAEPPRFSSSFITGHFLVGISYKL